MAKATFTVKWIERLKPGPAERWYWDQEQRGLRSPLPGRTCALTPMVSSSPPSWISRDQLRVAPDYKPDAPAVVTKVIEPLMPSTEEPPNKVTEPPPPEKELKPTSKRKHRLY